MPIDNKLNRIVESIDNLPPFPEIMIRILKMAEDPETSLKDIVKVVSHDQAITGNCLKLCNSSYFGLRTKVSSINHAISMMGLNDLIKVVLADCSRNLNYGRRLQGYAVEGIELWRHSVECALISTLLAEKLKLNNSHELFTAAILHDVGKLVIDSFIADDFEAIYSLMQEKEFGFQEAERQYFGIDHAEVGGMIARSWKFPESLVEAIQNHHQEMPAFEEINLQSLTMLSNAIFHMNQKVLSGCVEYEELFVQIGPGIQRVFNLGANDLREIMQRYPVEMEKAKEFLEVQYK